MRATREKVAVTNRVVIFILLKQLGDEYYREEVGSDAVNP